MNQKNFHLQCREKAGPFIITAFILALFFSCAKDEPEPLLSEGMLTGTVSSYDHSDLSTTRITAHGPYGSPSTLADADGSYELKGLGNGTYEVVFYKAGYGKIVRYGVQVYGNDTVRLNAWALRKMADYRMPKLSTVLYHHDFAEMNESDVAIVTDIPEGNQEPMQIRVFVGDQKNVSCTNYLHSDAAYAFARENDTQLMIFEANPQIVNGDGSRLFTRGQTLYAIAYVCSASEESGEFSEYYGLPIFTTADETRHSQVIKISAP